MSRGNRDRLVVHQVGRRDALDALGELRGDDRTARPLAQEPAEDHQPDPVDRITRGEQEEAEADQDVGEGLAEAAGEARRAMAVARDLPRDRPRDPAAVEREARHEVEHQQPGVDQREPAQQRQHRGGVVGVGEEVHAPVGVREQRHADRRQHRDQQRHGRPCGGDPELLARRLRVARELGQAAEDPEVDAEHLDAVAARDDRVAELVQGDRQEEQQRPGDRRHVGGGVGRVGQRVGKQVRQPPDHQEQEDEPAWAGPDADAEHPRELHRSTAAEHRAQCDV